MPLAPIVLFVYNRPWHTKQTVEALQKNELASNSELFIYSDAPKNEQASEKVKEVRQYIKTIEGFKKITIIEREKNWGLANSIIDGVTQIVNEYGTIIVLEDDLVTSQNFLNYMNESLKKYKDAQNVYSITGYSFSNNINTIDSTYFLKLTSSWSWGTWKDKWKDFSHDTSIFTPCLEDQYRFNYDDSYNYTGMIKQQLGNKIDSWAIYWYASTFMKNALTLYPSKSLVENIGFDGSGVHCGSTSIAKQKSEYLDYILTNDVVEKIINRKYISDILREQKQTIFMKITNRLKSIYAR